MFRTCDFLIVGAGIVGLTVAFELKRRHPKATITIIEKESDVAKHASGRNSGVMHSGVYYGSTTLKAKVCSAGAKKMREFAAEHNIACKKSGKVIIATSASDLPTIEKLLKNAEANGVKAEKLDEKSIKEIEPYASPYQAGIYSPDTAVIDSKSVVLKLRDLLTDQGVVFIYNAKISKVSKQTRSIVLPQGDIAYGYLYNCAGASADKVAKQFGFGLDYTLVPFKGIYFKIKPERAYLVNSNIYPVPDINLPFLGVHLTRVINGEVYVGPTAIPALGRENYGVIKGLQLKESIEIGADLLRMYIKNQQNFRLLAHTEMKKYFKPWFLNAAHKLMKELRSDDLVPCNKVGIRPQLINTRTSTLEMDYILEQGEHSIHVLNSISPAFTSSFAFAEWIVNQAEAE